MSVDRIETMRTAFTARGHAPVEPVMFAEGVLRRKKAQLEQQLREVGWIPADMVGILDVVLGDPNDPADAPLVALVNGGRWIAQCECGGAEHVDPETRLFMCGSCFNAEVGHRWRTVELPDAQTMRIVEVALLMRPEQDTRNWQADESVADLIAENVAHGLMEIGDEIIIEDPTPPVEIIVEAPVLLGIEATP
jgi:hypothetical protein